MRNCQYVTHFDTLCLTVSGQHVNMLTSALINLQYIIRACMNKENRHFIKPCLAAVLESISFSKLSYLISPNFFHPLFKSSPILFERTLGENNIRGRRSVVLGRLRIARKTNKWVKNVFSSILQGQEMCLSIKIATWVRFYFGQVNLKHSIKILSAHILINKFLIWFSILQIQ